jgi:GTPase SAR1 family protein
MRSTETITRAYYRGAQGVALVYDVTDARSFQAMTSWVESLDQHASRKVCKVLVANKCDRLDRRVVSTEEGERLAADHGCKYIETSAKTGLHVEDMFMTLAKEVKHQDIDPLSSGFNTNLKATDGCSDEGDDGIIDLKPPSKNIFQTCCST